MNFHGFIPSFSERVNFVFLRDETIWLFLQFFAALMNDVLISSVNVYSVNLAIIGGIL